MNIHEHQLHIQNTFGEWKALYNINKDNLILGIDLETFDDNKVCLYDNTISKIYDNMDAKAHMECNKELHDIYKKLYDHVIQFDNHMGEFLDDVRDGLDFIVKMPGYKPVEFNMTQLVRYCLVRMVDAHRVNAINPEFKDLVSPIDVGGEDIIENHYPQHEEKISIYLVNSYTAFMLRRGVLIEKLKEVEKQFRTFQRYLPASNDELEGECSFEKNQMTFMDKFKRKVKVK